MPGGTQREAVDTHHAASLVNLGERRSALDGLLDVARKQFCWGQRTSMPEGCEPSGRQARGDIAQASA